MTDHLIRNPHLDGDEFFWPAGSDSALLIHGFTATTAEVRLLGEYLHERGYTVAAPLLPGHGTTPQEMNRQKWQDWVNAVEHAYQRLKARGGRVFICGESMGALLALYTASEHPEIAGIVLYAPALRVANHTSTMLKVRALHRVVPMAKKPVRAPTAADARWKGYSVNPLRALVHLNELQRAVRRRLPRVHQPLLVIQGRLDQSIDLRSGEITLDGVASTDKQLVWLDESTHCVILDQEWEKAAELTCSFMERSKG